MAIAPPRGIRRSALKREGIAMKGLSKLATVLAFGGCVALGHICPSVAGDSTLATVKQRGQLLCGVFGVIPGFSLPDSKGVMRGIDADSCRAVAAAVLGNPDKVKYVMLTAQQRLPALQAGEVDVVFANVTWTFGREVPTGLAFPYIYYYDGQTFLVKTSIGAKTVKELDGASICLTQGSTHEANTQEYFSRNGMKYTSVVFADVSEARKAFLAGRCDAMAGDGTSLAGFKTSLGATAADYLILPEMISNEPLAAAVRKGDGQWLDVVRWTHFAMLTAEAAGIDSKNIGSFADSTDANVRRLLGAEGGFGEMLGLHNDWVVAVIKGVGNFAEMWDRNIIGIDRGLNRLWIKGGLQYAPPFR